MEIAQTARLPAHGCTGQKTLILQPAESCWDWSHIMITQVWYAPWPPNAQFTLWRMQCCSDSAVLRMLYATGSSHISVTKECTSVVHELQWLHQTALKFADTDLVCVAVDAFY